MADTNIQGLTPQGMSELATKQMQDRVLAESMSNPTTAGDPNAQDKIAYGAQTGSLQTGTGTTPVTYQALTYQPISDATAPKTQLISPDSNQNVLSASDANAYIANVRKATQGPIPGVETEYGKVGQAAQSITRLTDARRDPNEAINQEITARYEPIKEEKTAQQRSSALSAKAAQVSMGQAGTAFGDIVMENLALSHRRDMQGLLQQEGDARNAAWDAVQRGNVAAVMQEQRRLDTIQEQKAQTQKEFFQTQQEMAQAEKESKANVSDTITSFLKSGRKPSATQLSYWDQKYNLDSGTSEVLLGAAQSDLMFKNAKDDNERLAAAVDTTTKIANFFEKTEEGGSVKMGGITYTITGKTPEMYTGVETDENGNAVQWQVDKRDPTKVNIVTLGKIGSAKGGFTLQKDDQGRLWSINPNTGEHYPVFGSQTQTTYQALIPDGSKTTPWRPATDPMAGQCGAVMNDINDPSVGRVWGDTLDEKIAAVKAGNPKTGQDWSVPNDQAREGDTVVMSYGTTGHVGRIVQKVTEEGTGREKWRLFESNMIPPGARQTSSTRWIYADDKDIAGIARVPTRREFLAGPDSVTTSAAYGSEPTFGLGDQTKPTPDDIENAANIAKSIFSGASSQRLGDISTAKNLRSNVGVELEKLKKEALASGDFVGVMRASAGGKDVSDTWIQSFEKGANVLNQIADLQESFLTGKTVTGPDGTKIKEKESTGPFLGIWRSNDPYDTKAQKIKAQLTAIVPNLARGIYGEVGVLTDNDIKLYSRTLPNLNSTEEVRQAVLGVTIRSIQRSLERKIKFQAEGGRDVSGYVGTYLEMKQLADSLVPQSTELTVPEKNQTQVLDGVTYTWNGTNWESK